MALLSTDMIREIQSIADTYVERERERASRLAAVAAGERRTPGTAARRRASRPRDEISA